MMRYLYAGVVGEGRESPPSRYGVGRGQCMTQAKLAAMRGHTVHVWRRPSRPLDSAWSFVRTFRPEKMGVRL